jgi:predicted TIM-barrel fold metal-dependent hydrolase
MRLISADSHINEPPDLWTARLPARFTDRAPRVERFDDGDAWIMEGALDPINFGANCSAGMAPEEKSSWCRWEDVRPGGYEPRARLDDQDRDGVEAEVLYPTPRISNALFWNAADPDFHVACIRAYNDWLSELCAYEPDRLWGVAMIPNAGTDAAVAELHRSLALPGMRGAMLGQWPHGGLDIAPDDDPFWAAVAEAAVPVSVHVGFATEAPGAVARGKMRGDMRFFDAPLRAAQLIGSGVLDRFPSLQLVLAEVDCGWVPYLREQMDDRARREPRNPAGPAELPGHYLDHNFAYVFITDHYGIRNRDHVGVTRMLWSSDFPHSGSDWPNSKATIDEHFEGVADDDKHAILAGNALRLYASRG